MANEAVATDLIALPFDVPEDWRTPRLSTSCDFVRDGDWIESKDQGGDEYRLLQISNIGTGQFIETGNYRWITKATFERLNCTEILPGDVLVARMPEPTGRAWCVSEQPWRAVTAVDVAIIRTRNTELDPRFLAYFLNSPACLGIVQSLTTGTTRLRIRRADLERLQIPLPSVGEQRAITGILGALDDKIELNRRMNETLEAIARALFKSWFVDFDPVRAKAEGRDPGLPAHLADLFPDSFEDSVLGAVPLGWSTDSIYHIADVSYGAPYQSASFNNRREGLPLIRIRDLTTHNPEIFTAEVHPRDIVVEPGDIVVGMDGEFRAHSWRGPRARLNQRLCRFNPLLNVPKAFVRYSIETLLDSFERSKTGTTVIHLGKADIDTFRVLVPPISVLQSFANTADSIDNRIVNVGKEVRTLVDLRDTLLPRLISGELRVALR
jgi:type I restriction enzyme S subunit